MKNNKVKSGYLWLLLFLIVQVVAFLVIFKSDSTISPFWGFPSWLFSFFGIQILFSVGFYFFMKNYWAVEEPE